MPRCGARTPACRVGTRADAGFRPALPVPKCRDKSRHGTQECVRHLRRGYFVTGPKQRPLLLAILAALVSFSAAGHDIPNDVTVRAFLKPDGDRLRLLIRVPMTAMRDVVFPERPRGFLDLEHVGPLLPGAAKVWLSDPGRKKAIGLFEDRLQETWKHPVLNYSLSYARTIELEARLLEKEWTGEPGLFARSRLR